MPMTPESQRIAIAEECGWEFIGERDRYINDVLQAVPEEWRHEDGRVVYDAKDLPDFCHDLNAMHEAEGELNYEEIIQYESILGSVAFGSHAWYATAAQRAEAFLRTKGKWDE